MKLFSCLLLQCHQHKSLFLLTWSFSAAFIITWGLHCVAPLAFSCSNKADFFFIFSAEPYLVIA
jgi:hypothetical protein